MGSECLSDTSTDKHDRTSMTAGVERVDGDFHWVTRRDGQIVESRPLAQHERTWRFEDMGEALRPKKRDTRAEVAKESKVSERKLRSAVEIKKADPAAAERIRRGESTMSGSARS